ncbi:MAG: hypothetical protein SGPRY_004695 [Prymnesium sp.]
MKPPMELSAEQMLQQQAIHKREQMVRIYHALGQDMMQHAPATAHAFLLRALGITPREGQQENAQDAVRYLTRALEASGGGVGGGEGSHARIMLNLCAGLNKLGKHEEALQQAEKAASLLSNPSPRPLTGVEGEGEGVAGGGLGGRGRKVLLVTAAYQAVACHEYLGNRSAALRCADRGLSLASDASLSPDDELVVRLRASKRDLSKPGVEGRPVPPKQVKPPRDAAAAAEIEATSVVVAELVDAKARVEMQTVCARQALKEEVEGREGIVGREREARVAAERVAEESEERARKAECAASLSEEKVGQVRRVCEEHAERARARAEEAHRREMEALGSRWEQKVRDLSNEREERGRELAAFIAEMEKLNTQLDQARADERSCELRAAADLQAAEERAASELAKAKAEAEASLASSLESCARRGKACEVSLLDELGGLETLLAREASGRREASTGLERLREQMHRLRDECEGELMAERAAHARQLKQGARTVIIAPDGPILT